MGFTTREKRALMDSWEQELTNIALRGQDLVPDPMDMPRVRALSDMIYDLSEGRNEVIFNKAGQPNIMVNFPCTEKARLDYLAQSGTLLDVSNAGGMAPAFIVKDKPIKGFRLGKYNDVIANGRNNHVSLFGLPPAYGGGGFTESYDGLAGECERINNLDVYPEGENVHNITRAEWGYLAFLSAIEGFAVRGANMYGRDGNVSSEKGAPCGPENQYGRYHVLTGSGPNSWRHDGTPFGVWGLNGPVYQILHGFITDSGELLFLPNNDAAAATASELATGSAAYKGILEDGSFVDRGTPDTLKYDFVSTPTGNGQSFEIAKTLEHQSSDYYGGQTTGTLLARHGVTVPNYLRLLLCAALKTNTPHGTSYMRNGVGQVRVVLAGSDYYGSDGGFGRLDGTHWYSTDSGNNGGGRAASFMQ